MTDIASHNYLKKRMRFVSGQGILELKETRGKTRSGKWRLPSLIMCMYSLKEFLHERRVASQQLFPNSL